MAEHFYVSSRTVYRYLRDLPSTISPPQSLGKVIVLMDTTYWGRTFGVVIMKDAISGRVLWHKFIEDFVGLDAPNTNNELEALNAISKQN